MYNRAKYSPVELCEAKPLCGKEERDLMMAMIT